MLSQPFQDSLFLMSSETVLPYQPITPASKLACVALEFVLMLRNLVQHPNMKRRHLFAALCEGPHVAESLVACVVGLAAFLSLSPGDGSLRSSAVYQD